MQHLNHSLLADLTIFATIVRRQSMHQAAIELGVTTFALGHRMRKLRFQIS